MMPGTMWAYAASSAPVQVMDNFWQYFQPIAAAMPRNCSSALTKIVDYVDDVLLSGNRTAIHQLKKSFDLEHLKHDDDFAA